LDLSGKTALITGLSGAGGIVKAMALTSKKERKDGFFHPSLVSYFIVMALY